MKKCEVLLLAMVMSALAATQTGKFTAAFWGDCRSNSGRAFENIAGYLVKNRGTLVDVHWQNGDFTQTGSETDWAASWAVKNAREACIKDYFYMCTSNHDANATTYTANLRDILPSNGKNVFYYHTSWQLPNSTRKVHLCAVDCHLGSPLADQKAYFAEKLAGAGPHDWIVCLWHPPTWTEMTYKGNDSRAIEMANWFEEQNAAFVLTGHAHVYRRTHVMKSADRSVAERCQGDYHKSPNGSKGMIHIINGRGGVFSSDQSGSTWAGHAVALNLSESVGLITLMEFDDNKAKITTIGVGPAPDYAQTRVYDGPFTWERGPASGTTATLPAMASKKSNLLYPAHSGPVDVFSFDGRHVGSFSSVRDMNLRLERIPTTSGYLVRTPQGITRTVMRRSTAGEL